jgi:intracellular septation protein
MKFLFDMFPVILFFVVFKTFGIYEATATAIVATFAQIGWVYFRQGKVEPMLWVSLAVITVFGGATIYLQNETFIKWKPTVLYWLFAAGLGIAALIFKKNLIRAMMEKQMTLPEPLWGRVLLSWIAFFVIMGVINLYVAFNYSTDTWVSFKLFGGIGLMLVFVIGQALMLSKHIQEKKPD